MSNVAEYALEIRRRWIKAGLLGDEILNADIDRLEKRIGKLPSSYKSFLSTAGVQTDSDAEGYLFWPPVDVRSLREVSEALGYYASGKEAAVVIADYLQESWWYCLWIAGPNVGTVFLAGLKESGATSAVGDMATFLEAYLCYSPSMYPPD